MSNLERFDAAIASLRSDVDNLFPPDSQTEFLGQSIDEKREHYLTNLTILSNHIHKVSSSPDDQQSEMDLLLLDYLCNQQDKSILENSIFKTLSGVETRRSENESDFSISSEDLLVEMRINDIKLDVNYEANKPKLGFDDLRRISTFSIYSEIHGNGFDYERFVLNNTDEILSQRSKREELLTLSYQDQHETQEIPEPCTEQHYWKSLIQRSPLYHLIKKDNEQRFIDFLVETNKFDEGPRPEFYIRINCSSGVPASRAGNLVKLYNGEPTGFFDMKKSTTVGTAGDMVRMALLEKLPERLGDAAEFGTLFEFAAKEAFEARYEKKTGVKLKSILNSEMRRKLLHSEATAPYKNSLDQLYHDSKNDRLILVDFKMPQKLNGTFEESQKPIMLMEDYEMQMAIYSKAVEAELGRKPDQSTVFQFGMNGMKDLLSSIKNSDSKEKVKSMIKSQVRMAVMSDSKMIQAIENDISFPELSSKYGPEVWKRAAEHFVGAYLNKGVPPAEPEKHSVNLTDDNKAIVERKFTQHSINSYLADKVNEQNNKLKKKISEIKKILATDKLKCEAGSSGVSSRAPNAEILFKRAIEAGVKLNRSDFLVEKEVSQVLVNASLVKDLAVKSDIELSSFQNVTTYVGLNRDYTFKTNYEPALNAIADKISLQAQSISVNLSPNMSFDNEFTGEKLVNEENQDLEGLGYSVPSVSF